MSGIYVATTSVEPTTPSAGNFVIYNDIADNITKVKKETGAVVSLEDAGGSGGLTQSESFFGAFVHDSGVLASWTSSTVMYSNTFAHTLGVLPKVMKVWLSANENAGASTVFDSRGYIEVDLVGNSKTSNANVLRFAPGHEGNQIFAPSASVFTGAAQSGLPTTNDLAPGAATGIGARFTISNITSSSFDIDVTYTSSGGGANRINILGQIAAIAYA